MSEGHAQAETHQHEVIEHHEPSFGVKIRTYIWTAVVIYTLIQLMQLISNHIVHDLIVEIKDFLAH